MGFVFLLTYNWIQKCLCSSGEWLWKDWVGSAFPCATNVNLRGHQCVLEIDLSTASGASASQVTSSLWASQSGAHSIHAPACRTQGPRAEPSTPTSSPDPNHCLLSIFKPLQANHSPPPCSVSSQPLPPAQPADWICGFLDSLRFLQFRKRMWEEENVFSWKHLGALLRARPCLRTCKS